MTNLNYYITETDTSQLFNLSGLPEEFQRLFVRDYTSIKTSVSGSIDDISSLAIRINDAEDDILMASSTLSALAGNFNAHTLDTSAHNATGNIVGTDDYCTLTVGGSVLLAAAEPNASVTAAIAALNPAAAGAAYVQADAVTWVNAINEHKTAIAQLNTNISALVSKINSMLSSERTAKQRAP